MSSHSDCDNDSICGCTWAWVKGVHATVTVPRFFFIFLLCIPVKNNLNPLWHRNPSVMFISVKFTMSCFVMLFFPVCFVSLTFFYSSNFLFTWAQLSCVTLTALISHFSSSHFPLFSCDRLFLNTCLLCRSSLWSCSISTSWFYSNPWFLRSVSLFPPVCHVTASASSYSPLWLC